jgi:hypothetical protein
MLKVMMTSVSRVKRCVVINFVGPENSGKNMFGSALTLKLQKLKESAEFARPDSYIEDLIEQFDFVVQNSGAEIDLATLTNPTHLIPRIYFTVLLSPYPTNEYTSLESQFVVHSLREQLESNRLYFVQISNEFTPEKIERLTSIALLVSAIY